MLLEIWPKCFFWCKFSIVENLALFVWFFLNYRFIKTKSKNMGLLRSWRVSYFHWFFFKSNTRILKICFFFCLNSYKDYIFFLKKLKRHCFFCKLFLKKITLRKAKQTMNIEIQKWLKYDKYIYMSRSVPKYTCL